MPSLADAALALGVPVFPCGADKQPLTTRGFKDASTDAVTVRSMFANPAAVLIGVPTGAASGWVVIDIDIKNGARGRDWLDANARRLPETRTHKTQSGGLHLVFRLAEIEIRNSKDRLGPGVDVRGEGGYVIMPPSPGYVVADATEMADMPDWLVRACDRPAAPVPATAVERQRPSQDGGTPYGLKALEDECDAIRGAGFGNQEHTLNSACLKIGALVAGGEIEEGVALAELLAAGRSMASQPGKRPWLGREVENKVRRAFADGQRSARQAPNAPIQASDAPHPAAALLAKHDPQRQAKPLPVSADLMDVDGVLKLFVDECLQTAYRPQPFLALGAAICTIGALAGRQYRTWTDLRTNIYIAAIVESGGGKDHPSEIARRAITRAGLDRYLGGETIASGRAVLSSLEQHPAKLFQIDEFGLFLLGVTGKKAAPHKAEIWSELMKLYSRAKGIYKGTEYASKKDNPRVDIHQPCVSFYGTSTPSTFWAALEAGAMSDGSLARFLVFISDNDRPERNRAAGIFEPSEALVAALQAIACGSGGLPEVGNLGAVHISPMLATEEPAPFIVTLAKDAEALYERKLDHEDAWATKVRGTPQAAIVNRVGENATKLALISAISHSSVNPVIRRRDLAWGWALAEHCTRSLLQDADRFISDSEFGAKVNKMLEVVRKRGPVTPGEITTFYRLPLKERDEILRSLVESGEITALATKPAGGGAGRPTVKYSIATPTKGAPAEGAETPDNLSTDLDGGDCAVASTS